MWMMLLAMACADGDVDAQPGHFVLVGGQVVGLGLADVTVKGAVIMAVGEADEEVPVIDVSGRYLVPAFIDSHVHLEYWPVASELADGGVAAAVDLAAPDRIFSIDFAPLRVMAAGPMVTAPGGYPTMSWGSDGYGRVVADTEQAVAAVDSLIDAGAKVIKIPVTDGPSLSEQSMAAATARAHDRGVKVAAHALEDTSAMLAAEADMDVLAHTPVVRLESGTVSAWGSRAVVSSLVAFGDGETARSNLLALSQAGTVVLYGTDLGNRRHAGIDAQELGAMEAAGLSPAQILAAGTRAPADYWGFSDLGRIEVGARASILVLAADPLNEITELASPQMVFIEGQRR